MNSVVTRMTKRVDMIDTFKVDPAIVGRRLADARKAAGLSQEQAAAHLECSRPTLIAMEKGTRPPKPTELIALAQRYGRSVHELVREGPEVRPLEPHLRASIGKADADELAQAIRLLAAFAEDYRILELKAGATPFADYPPEVVFSQRVDVTTVAEDVAIRERNRLHLGDQPVLRLRSVLEEAGVHVFYGDLPSTLAGMYAFVPELGYCVLVNHSHLEERRRWTLAHEYAHFLADRHKPGVDYVGGQARKPNSERFADAFAASFLMPETAVRRHFLAVTTRTGDFQAADLCRMASLFFVSVKALCRRLVQLRLLPAGTWEMLTVSSFKPIAARRTPGLDEPAQVDEQPYPERYRHLAVRAFVKEDISEGQLARFLRTDRVTARGIVEATLMAREVDDQGNEQMMEIPYPGSLLDVAQRNV